MPWKDHERVAVWLPTQDKMMRMLSKEFCETGQVRIKLKKKNVRMSYETGQIQASSVYIRRSIRDAVKEPDRPKRRRRKSREAFKENSRATQEERRVPIDGTFTQHSLHSSYLTRFAEFFAQRPHHLVLCWQPYFNAFMILPRHLFDSR